MISIIQNRRTTIALSGLLATTAILAALAFEHLGGYRPCPLCLTQRYAYYLGVPAIFVAYLLDGRGAHGLANVLLALVALGFLVNAGLGVYHAGVEWRWWEGPSTCAASAGGLTTDAGDLLGALSKAEVVRCDEVQLRVLGLSFAGWNALVSLAVSGLALQGLRLRLKP